MSIIKQFPPPNLHHPETVKEATKAEYCLPDADDKGEDHGAEADSKHPVHEEAPDHGQHHVGPGVPGVEVGELGRRHVHRHLDVRLQGTGVVEAEIGTEPKEAHHHQCKDSMDKCLKMWASSRAIHDGKPGGGRKLNQHILQVLVQLQRLKRFFLVAP